MMFVLLSGNITFVYDKRKSFLLIITRLLQNGYDLTRIIPAAGDGIDPSVEYILGVFSHLGEKPDQFSVGHLVERLARFMLDPLQDRQQRNQQRP
jgi:hypothetical protein